MKIHSRSEIHYYNKIQGISVIPSMRNGFQLLKNISIKSDCGLKLLWLILRCWRNWKFMNLVFQE